MKPIAARITERLRQEIVRIGRSYDVVVVSYGGSGTTMLANILGRYLRVNAPNSERDGILHASSPNHPIFRRLRVRRAIYVYADPAEAVLSIFNRDFQDKMLVKINSMHETRAEYLRNIRANSKPITLDELLCGDRDPFKFGHHLHNWTAPEAADFPILCVKYDALFKSATVIADYVGDARVARSFPTWRPRKTRLSDLAPDQQSALLRLYDEDSKIYRQLPDVFEPATKG